MIGGAPLQAGVAIFVVLALLMMLLIPSIVAGVLVSLATIPLLYCTGYGFVPLHRAPAYGVDFTESVLLHIAGGTLTFGTAMLGSLLSSHYLSGGVPLPVIGAINGGLFLTITTLSVALVITALVSKPNGQHISSPKPVLELVGVWYGYPIVLLGALGPVLIVSGVGTYQPPGWFP